MTLREALCRLWLYRQRLQGAGKAKARECRDATLAGLIKGLNILLLNQSQNLMAVLLGILATADMYPEVTAVGGLHNELIIVSVGLEP